MNEDLKWLAENVHEWDVRFDRVAQDGKYPEWFNSKYFDAGKHGLTRAQWQAARDELSGKPSWDDAPEWANWLAQDKDGAWWCYKEKPIPQSVKFGNEFKKRRVAFGKVLDDWRNTLERRPENHSAEPTEKVWRGPEDGLPPVGEMVETWFDDGKCCWHKAHVVGYHPSETNTLAVSLIGDHESRLIWSEMSGIRPLRTEEDKAVEEMVSISMQTPMIKSLVQIETAHRDACRALYRAGYRKQEAE